MQKTKFTQLLSLLICITLITATVLFATSCSDTTTENPANPTSSETTTEDIKEPSDSTNSDVTVLGEGEKQFTFTVIDTDSNETVFTVNTDETTVGAALIQLGLIEGEDGPYGLYVKTVNGETHDYETDGKYWAFYENGKYAASGVDLTDITNGATYSFKAEK